MIAWVQGHAVLVVACVAFGAGASVGLLLMAVLVSGRDPAEVRDAERRAGHW